MTEKTITEIITRAQARELGLKKYYNGVPCKHGHICERETRWAKCYECKKIKDAAYYAENADKIAVTTRKYYEKNRENLIEQSKIYRLANLEKVAASKKKHYRENKKEILGKQKEYYAKNVEKITAVNKNWADRNPEKVTLAKKKYYTTNKKILLERWRKFSEENKEFVAARTRRYRANNIENVRARERIHTTKRRSAVGTHTFADIKFLLLKQKNKCVVCKKHLSVYHVDHIMPLYLGGTNDKKNIQILCPKCNLKKNKKHPIDFMQENGFLL